MKQAALLACCAALPAAATLYFDLRWKLPPEFREVKALEAGAHLTEYIWVDVRSFDRYENAHIGDAIPFDEAQPTEALKKLRSLLRDNKKIVVYGEGAGSDRALRVARLLKKELGATNVYLLEGGWATWPRH